MTHCKATDATRRDADTFSIKFRLTKGKESRPAMEKERKRKLRTQADICRSIVTCLWSTVISTLNPDLIAALPNCSTKPLFINITFGQSAMYV